ncbi:Late embryogenesis abundant (LEA) protein-related [Euphorbia peplus]|nr:Late embryogenesis abundant (LEA) protein-related [Euphorbia peplus]
MGKTILVFLLVVVLISIKVAGVEDFDDITPLKTGQERAQCKLKKGCTKALICPAQCPQKKPKQNKKNKGCHIDCSGRCEATCKWRKPNCNGYGSLCYDPRFVGGDGVMFYFHGAKGGNFAVISDNHLQINAHFIGTRPQGRTRDFTWVQALNVMFDDHNLVISANKISQWSHDVDALTVRWDGKEMNIPVNGETKWGDERKVQVERTDDRNSVRVKVEGLLEMDIRVRPIGKQENIVHKYELPENDAFAHLETQFKFNNLSNLVEGILGKTYRPDYVSSAKTGVPMPVMGGEDKYQTLSLFSPLCRACRFQTKSALAAI